MSKLTTVAVILAVAAVAIGAKQMTSEAQVAPAASVAPLEVMMNVGPLPETMVSSYF
jgi:hypothetical protein